MRLIYTTIPCLKFLRQNLLNVSNKHQLQSDAHRGLLHLLSSAGKNIGLEGWHLVLTPSASYMCDILLCRLMSVIRNQ